MKVLYRKRWPWLGLLIPLWLCVACEVEQLEAGYLFVPDVAVVPNGRVEPDGILGVRVVVGSRSLGFYPVPATIPVLAAGNQTVRIEPAIRRSGLSQEIRVYPLYEPFVTAVTIVPGRTDTLRPVYPYASTATVGFSEDFETPSSKLIVDLVAAGSAPLSQNTADPRDGAASGRISLSSEKTVYEVTTGVIVPDRANLLDLWVEVDFRGEVPLAVALFPTSIGELPSGVPRISRYFQGGLPREDWTRLYFDIEDESNDGFVDEGFRVSLLAVYDPEAGGIQTVDIDNLRVVYR